MLDCRTELPTQDNFNDLFLLILEYIRVDLHLYLIYNLYKINESFVSFPLILQFRFL